MNEAQTTTEAPASVTPTERDDAAMDAAYEKAMASDEPDTGEGLEAGEKPEDFSRTRDEKGRFAKAEQASEVASPPEESEGTTQDEEPGNSTQVSTAGLPANWRPDMADLWEKLPEADRARLGPWAQELHSKMSEQGRQIAQLREFQPIVEHMVQAFPNKFGPGGVPPAQGLAALVDAAYMLDRQPVEAVMQLASEAGVLPQLAQALGVQGGGDAHIASLQQTISNLERRLAGFASPDHIQQQIDLAMSVREITSSVERFKAEKPFYADVEAKLPTFIEIAWSEAPNASPDEIHQMAYDMAVNAMPAVREKARAAALKAAATKPDPMRAAAAKKAASINVKSTSTGRASPKSEDELMDEAYNRAMAS